MMLIDWFTVVAQIINFLVLVFLLKRFLYRPIIKAMDKREETIASRLREAEQRKVEAEDEMKLYHQKNRELDATREGMLAQAREEAETNKKDWMERARQEVDELKARWHEAVREEKESFLSDLERRAGRQIYAIASRSLADLSDSDLEQRIIGVFLVRLSQLGNEEVRKIKESAQKSRKGIGIFSTFEIPANKQQEITRGIHAYIADGIDITFKTSPDILCGIELKTNGYVIGWNLNNYLKTLEEETSKAIEEGIGSKSETKEDKKKEK